jgi:predicted transcriptional regulator
MKKGSSPVAMKPVSEETKQLTAIVPPDVYRKLQRLAAAERRSMSFLISEAIAKLLKAKAA